MKKAAKEDLWIKIPIRLLLDSDLTGRDIVLLAVICDLCDREGIAWASLEQLAGYCGCSERTVRRSEARLCAADLIEIERTGRASMIAIKDRSLLTGTDWSAIRQYRRGA